MFDFASVCSVLCLCLCGSAYVHGCLFVCVCEILCVGVCSCRLIRLFVCLSE